MCRYSGYRCCHWCKVKGRWSYGIKRMVFERHRRLLAANDPVRRDPTYGDTEDDVFPAARNHDESARDGERARAHTAHPYTSSRHPYSKTSIRFWCALVILHLFDMVKDFVPDTMHILKDFWSLHFIPLFKGLRLPARYKAPRPTPKVTYGRVTPADKVTHAQNLAKWLRAKAENKQTRKVGRSTLVTVLKYQYTTCTMARVYYPITST
jgi:hypothetical protein